MFQCLGTLVWKLIYVSGDGILDNGLNDNNCMIRVRLKDGNSQKKR